ncbi:hypothetical protein [Spiroplasma sp. DGKH1]|uniref:hypothetical protein n=1 Tax=Spiroplasma sp. DGKH1 TaxID=3050074 RepID=UPI0034C6C76A
MYSYSKVNLTYDFKKSKDYIYCDIELANGLKNNGYAEIRHVINFLITHLPINYSIPTNLLATKDLENGLYYAIFYSPQSIKDIEAYARGKYVHKTIYLPQLVYKVVFSENLSEKNNWKIYIYAFEGTLTKDTKLYALKLPHFFTDSGLCQGNISRELDINDFNEASKAINIIFNTRFIHEWTEDYQIWEESSHFTNGLNGLSNYHEAKTFEEFLSE